MQKFDRLIGSTVQAGVQDGAVLINIICLLRRGPGGDEAVPLFGVEQLGADAANPFRAASTHQGHVEIAVTPGPLLIGICTGLGAAL